MMKIKNKININQQLDIKKQIYQNLEIETEIYKKKKLIYKIIL